MQCIFKEVVTPQQKLICAAAGFALAGVGCWKVYSYTKNKLVDTRLTPLTARERQVIEFDRKYIKPYVEALEEKRLFNISMFLFQNAFLFAVGKTMVDLTSSLYKDVIVFSHCCPIIRRSALYVACMASLSGVMYMSVMTASSNFYKAFYENKKWL